MLDEEARDDSGMKILVFGAAGCIGFHLIQRLRRRGDEVFSVDDLRTCHDPTLKQAPLVLRQPSSDGSVLRLAVVHRPAMEAPLTEEQLTSS